MALSDETNDVSIWLASLPPTPQQRRLAQAVAIGLSLAFVLTAPFASLPLPRFDSFIPSLDSAIFVIALITSVLLFAQFTNYRSRALLALANGYLFTALIVVPHLLTFPGAFSRTGLLGAGLQSTVWLYVFWHFGFPASVLIYAWLKDEPRVEDPKGFATLIGVGCSVAIVLGIVCGLTWIATVGSEFLPHLIVDGARLAPSAFYVTGMNALLLVLALAVLWVRRRSALDQWLMVVAYALILEMVSAAFLGGARYNLGFYAGRMFSLAASTGILAVLIAETIRLDVRLARSNVMLRLERKNKLMNLEVMVASISHEVRQPIAAIATNSGAALKFLEHVPPDLEEVRSALKMIVSDCRRASEVFDNIRALFGRSDQVHKPIEMNEVALGVLRTMQRELDEHGIVTRTELTAELPLVMGNKGQLEEVIHNLIRNAIEAMAPTVDRGRSLWVRTDCRGREEIVVTIEDSGPGIHSEQLEGVFEAFVSTKAHGMGLGLAICRMIIERHGGRLAAFPNDKKGGLFKFFLPARAAPRS